MKLLDRVCIKTENSSNQVGVITGEKFRHFQKVTDQQKSNTVPNKIICTNFTNNITNHFIKFDANNKNDNAKNIY
ncbi:MAG: hypothetical protein PHE33_09025 [Bacteroidales bacterium]|nr:hypothetical protein [Bacteroidales bacterium]